MAYPSLKIAGRDLSIISFLDFDQRIEGIGGSSVRRMANGAAIKLTHYRKHRITLSAGGWVPPQLSGINYDAPFEIELPKPVALVLGDSLPAGWSQRAAPWDAFTMIDQAGVSTRCVYVKMTVMADEPVQSIDGQNNRQWELVCETV